MDAITPASPAQPKRLSLRPQWRNNRLSFVASIAASSDAPTSPGTAPFAMDQSPLTQQNQPETVYEPKVISLYKQLLSEAEDDEKAEGFWRELFLLKQDIPRLRHLLSETESNFMLHHQHVSQQFVLHAIDAVKEGRGPADENALDALTVFFAVVLSKRYTNPSADIIEVLAGLDHVDTVFNDLVVVLDKAIKDGRITTIRQKAVRTAISVVAGGYQTALVSYFISRDFFPALMKLVHTLENPLQALEPLLLTGLLVNYNKFEMHNQYRVRLADFVHDSTMVKAIESIGWTSVLLRDHYVAIQDDTPVGWSFAGTLTGTLSYVGLGSLASGKTTAPVLTEDQQKELFAEQPGHQAATLLSAYDFNCANALFRRLFILHPSTDKDHPAPISNFLSLTSYLYQHAYRSARAELYAFLTSMILLLLAEDPITAKLLCDTSTTVRLCRQRPPTLPLVQKERPLTAAIMDVLIDGINHNLRKRLDTAFYVQSLAVLSRLLTYLAQSRTKLAYHWSELWRSVLSFVRFLTAYASELKSLSGTQGLVKSVVELLMIALASGESFLPDAASYDDLFYKLVESGEVLTKLREAYSLGKATDKHDSIGVLIGVSRHYQELIDTHKSKNAHLSPKEVSQIIKQGYDTLSIEAREGLDRFEPFREAEHKVMLKKIARVAVADSGALVASS